MNTPFGNSITTAEHAIALMFALARQLPEADASTQAGKWEKNRFMGVEVTGKTLGLIGAGNIGSIVATRALGLRMKVAAFDPFLTPERAVELGVDKVELDDLLRRADFITLHTPLTDQTRNILSRENLAKTRKGVRIINCARGGLIDEQALKEALDSGHVAGAALDVFEKEPATASPLFGTPGFISTPHLGASTSEAQVNVAIQVAEQMSDYLLLGGVTMATPTRVIALSAPDWLYAVVVHPDQILETRRARAVLAEPYPLPLVVEQSTHLALFLTGLQRGDGLGLQLGGAPLVARRVVERHDGARAHAARDLAGLPRGQVVLALGMVGVRVKEHALDVQPVHAVEQRAQLADVHLAAAVHQRVLVDPAHAGGVGSDR